MNVPDELAEAFSRFITIENEEWGTGTLAQMQRYAWRAWYSLSFLQYQRLVAEWLRKDRECVGGLPRLEQKVAASLSESTIDLLRPPVFVEGPLLATLPLSPRADLGQLLCDEDSRTRVSKIVCNDFPYGASVAMLGDDDLVGTMIANEYFPVTILDVDKRIGVLVGERDYIKFLVHDIREPWRSDTRFDAVLLDPADGSIALEAWVRRADETLSKDEGARIYLSVNPWRLGRRWSRLIEEFGQYNLIPVAAYAAVKVYPRETGRGTTTDLWVFERTARPSRLPQPYLDIEVFR